MARSSFPAACVSRASAHCRQSKPTLVQAKTEESDSVVDGICHDIKQLDAAKRNLTSTITALRRLQVHAHLKQIDCTGDVRVGC